MLKYYIGDIGFKSKKNCEKYTRDIITNLECRHIDKTHQFYNFFINHPNSIEKIGSGIDYFYVQRNILTNNYDVMMIIVK